MQNNSLCKGEYPCLTILTAKLKGKREKQRGFESLVSAIDKKYKEGLYLRVKGAIAVATAVWEFRGKHNKARKDFEYIYIARSDEFSDRQHHLYSHM